MIYSITGIPMPIIGRSALIAIAGIQDIPVKVDTGADSSSVWASNITEHNGVLEFVLFDESSSLYTGERLRMNEYGKVGVSSSNGHRQMRYTVNLPVVIAGEQHTGRFTLANRKAMSYPVLLGRKFLHDTFMVDVTKGIDHDTHKQLLHEREQRLQSEQN